MIAFSVKEDVAWTTRYGQRQLKAHPDGDQINVGNLIISVHDELSHVEAALAAQARSRLGFVSTADILPTVAGRVSVFHEAELMAWKHLPVRLGRVAFGADPMRGAEVIADPSPLQEQLRRLRERKPHQQHFRVALINGFGSSLGDMVIGATAWRIVRDVIAAALPSFAADVLLGPAAGPATADLIAHEANIRQVIYQGPSLLEFARYDAFFDVTDLLAMPRFMSMAHVDWLLWWMGLDPEVIPALRKRNRLHLPQPEWEWARQQLAGRQRPIIALVWRASVPLRSMPDDTAARLARDLLALAPHATIVVDQRLDLVHPRLLDLGAEADSPQKMMALIAQADGLVSVDSLAAHVADAADIPSMTLLATFPHTRFPYYPNMGSITPPGMNALPGWGVTKLAEERFAGLRGAYRAAWEGVSAAQCWASLEERLRDRAPAEPPGITIGERWDPARSADLPPPGTPFPHDVVHPVVPKMDAQMARIAALVLRPGAVAVMAMADDGDVAIELARRVAPTGALHVLEPRRLRAQKLLADLQRDGLATVWLHQAVAGPVAARTEIPEFDPASEADPSQFGNTLRLTPVPVLALDDLALPTCAVLVVRPPQDALETLQGATALLQTARPLIVVGPLAVADAQAIANLLVPFGYHCWVTRPQRTTEVVQCVATPQEAPFALNGFERLHGCQTQDPGDHGSSQLPNWD